MGKYFDIWPQIGEIERDLQKPYVTCAAWVRRGEIPRAHDARLIEVLRSKGRKVTFPQLDAWHNSHASRRKLLRSMGLAVECQDVKPFPAMPWIQVTQKTGAAE